MSLIENMKHLPTTIPGILAILAALPQDVTIQHLMNLSPNAARWVSGIAGVAAGLLLILGQRQNQSTAEKAIQDAK